MKQRILVAVIGVPALIGVLCFAPDWATAVLVAALCVIGCHEFMGAAAPEKAAHWWGLAATLSVFTVFTVYFSGGAFAGSTVQRIMTWLLAALIVVMFIAAVQAYGKDDELDFPDISAMAVSGLVIPLALGCLVRLRMLEYGAGLVLIPLVSAFMSDSLALFEEGTGLAASCRTQLDRAEQQVVRLMKGADGAPVETEFTGEE